ncbi:MAG: P-II family nitrogen regulator [Clostridiales bacterium]|jgi:nitrogen regulatory protein PII|nr:P-II family nitrogen regulator [Clostridiales bacterium]
MIKLLNIIIERKLSGEIIKLGQKSGVILANSTFCKGVASSRRLALLGLGESEKSLIHFAAEDSIIQEILEVLKNDYKIKKAGNGIAFSIPISSVVGKKASEMLKGTPKENKENITNGSENNMEYELIVAILNRGYAEMAMQAAKEAGAKGGTIVKALGSKENLEAEFLGVPIHDEKDKLYVLTNIENKDNIMQAISKEAGLSTQGMGICYSMPVIDVVGLNA